MSDPCRIKLASHHGKTTRRAYKSGTQRKRTTEDERRIHRSAVHQVISIRVLHCVALQDLGNTRIYSPTPQRQPRVPVLLNTRQMYFLIASRNRTRRMYSRLLFILFCSFCALSSSSHFHQDHQSYCDCVCTKDGFLLFQDIRTRGTKFPAIFRAC